MSVQEVPASLTVIRWSLVSVTLISLCAVMVAGAVVLQQQRTHRPIQLDLLTTDTGAKVCINGFSYKLQPSDSDPLFGGAVEVLELEQEPKGEIIFGPDGQEYPRRNGPKACASKG